MPGTGPGADEVKGTGAKAELSRSAAKEAEADSSTDLPVDAPAPMPVNCGGPDYLFEAATARVSAAATAARSAKAAIRTIRGQQASALQALRGVQLREARWRCDSLGPPAKRFCAARQRRARINAINLQGPLRDE